MRRTKLSGKRRGKKGESISSAKKKAWKFFSEYIRLRDAIRTTGSSATLVCVTCGKPFPVVGIGCGQAGHFIAGRNNSILYEETNCHGQCYVCNVHKHGNAVEYYVFMEKTYGKEEIERLRALSHQVVPMTAQDHLAIRDKYQKKIEELHART